MVYLMNFIGPLNHFDIRSTSMLIDTSNPTSISNLNQVEYELNTTVFGGIETAKNGFVIFISQIYEVFTVVNSFIDQFTFVDYTLAPSDPGAIHRVNKVNTFRNFPKIQRIITIDSIKEDRALIYAFQQFINVVDLVKMQDVTNFSVINGEYCASLKLIDNFFMLILTE